MKLVRVSGKKGFVGVFETNGAVQRTNHILRFMLGWPDDKARATIRRNGWKAAIIPPHTGTDLISLLTESLPATPTSIATEEAALRTGRHGSGPVEHHCHCGAWGSYGVDVFLRDGQEGVWFCVAHRPPQELSTASVSVRAA